MADNISTPSGMGGLMRFNEEYPSKLRISPEMVVVMIAIVIIGITIIKIAFKYA
jgi:preprotein translocase subunit Sec61beta